VEKFEGRQKEMDVKVVAVRTCIGYTLSRKTLFLVSGKGKYD